MFSYLQLIKLARDWAGYKQRGNRRAPPSLERYPSV